jgi:hypothetical protein
MSLKFTSLPLRTNAPHMIKPGKAFVFAAQSCREEDE